MVIVLNILDQQGVAKPEGGLQVLTEGVVQARSLSNLTVILLIQ